MRSMSYLSDLTDEEWALVDSVFNAPGKCGRKHAPDLAPWWTRCCAWLEGMAAVVDELFEGPCTQYTAVVRLQSDI